MKNDKNFFAVFTKKPKGDIMYLVNLLITGVKKAFFMILRVLKRKKNPVFILTINKPYHTNPTKNIFKYRTPKLYR